MEKDVAVGNVGKLALSFSAGKAVVAFNAVLPGGVVVAMSVSDDAGALIDQLEAEVAKVAPVTAPFDPAIFGVIKSAVVAIQ